MAHEISVEMTANVWKILVKEGDTVTDGDEIAILESMKMEIPVLTEVDGVVTHVKVKENDAVNEGDVIAIVG